MTLVYEFSKSRSIDGSLILKPTIPLIVNSEIDIETQALIDSGADISAMPIALAERLCKIPDGAMSPGFGIGGPVEAIETELSVTIGNESERHSIKIPIKILSTKSDFPFLLGRKGFFDEFVICFNQPEDSISLQKASSQT